jgi:hypothetical protein
MVVCLVASLVLVTEQIFVVHMYKFYNIVDYLIM